MNKILQTLPLTLVFLLGLVSNIIGAAGPPFLPVLRNSVTTNAFPVEFPNSGDGLVWDNARKWWTNGAFSATATNAIADINGGTSNHQYIVMFPFDKTGTLTSSNWPGITQQNGAGGSTNFFHFPYAFYNKSGILFSNDYLAITNLFLTKLTNGGLGVAIFNGNLLTGTNGWTSVGDGINLNFFTNFNNSYQYADWTMVQPGQQMSFWGSSIHAKSNAVMDLDVTDNTIAAFKFGTQARMVSGVSDTSPNHYLLQNQSINEPTNVIVRFGELTNATWGANMPNTWYIRTDPAATNRVFAWNYWLGRAYSSNDFGGLMQQVLYEWKDGGHIHIYSSQYTNAAYVVSNTVAVTNWGVISGDGNPSTVLRAASSLSGPMFKVGTNTQVGGISRWEKLRFELSQGTSFSSGIQFVNCAEPVIESCEFNQPKFAGLQFTQPQFNHWSYIHNTWFVLGTAGSYGVLIDSTPSDINSQNLKIDECFFGIGDGTGVAVSNRFQNVTLLNNLVRWTGPSTSANGFDFWAGENFLVGNNIFQDWPTSISPIRFEDRSAATNYNSMVFHNITRRIANASATNLVYVGNNVQGVSLIMNDGFGTKGYTLQGNNGQIVALDRWGLVSDTNYLGQVKFTGGQTPSRVLYLDSGTNVIPVTSGSPSTEYVHPDGTTGTPAGGSVGPGSMDFDLTQFATNSRVVLKNGAVATNVSIRGITEPNLTASRAAVINSAGVLTNALGTPDGTKFLRDDNTYATPPGATGPGMLDFDLTQFATNSKVVLKNGAVATNVSIRGITEPNVTATRAAVFNSAGVLTNASGTPDGTKFLRDDNTYAAVPAQGTNFAGILLTNVLERSWVYQGTNATFSLDWSKTNIVIVHPSGTNLTITMANTPAAGSPARQLTLYVYASLASVYTATWPTAVDFRSGTPAIVTGITNMYVFDFNGTNVTLFSAQDYSTGNGQTNTLNDSALMINQTNKNIMNLVGTIGTQTPELRLWQTNFTGYLGFTYPLNWLPTNILNFTLTNVAAGDVLYVTSVANSSGARTVNLTNFPSSSIGGSGSTNTPVIAVGNIDLTNQVIYRMGDYEAAVVTTNLDFAKNVMWEMTNAMTGNTTYILTNLVRGKTAVLYFQGHATTTNTIKFTCGTGGNTNIYWQSPTNGNSDITVYPAEVVTVFMESYKLGATNIAARYIGSSPLRPAAFHLLSVQGGFGSNIVVGGVQGQTMAYTANANGTATLTPLVNCLVPANTMTNDGDSVVFKFRGIMKALSPTTNQFSIILSNAGNINTILDTGLQIISNTTYRGEVTMTRMPGSSISHIVDAKFEWGLGPSQTPFAWTNNFTNAVLNMTNGIPINMSLVTAARLAGSHTNTWAKSYFEPGYRQQ